MNLITDITGKRLDITDDFLDYCKNKVANFILVQDSDVEGEAKSRKLKTAIVDFDGYENNDDYRERVLSNIFFELICEFVDRIVNDKDELVDVPYPNQFIVYIKEIFQHNMIERPDFYSHPAIIISYKFKKK